MEQEIKSPEETNSNEDNKGKVNIVKETLQWIGVIAAAMAIALVIRAFLFEPALVQGASMNNTLENNQRLFIYKLGYIISQPQRGDIIVLEYQQGAMKYLPLPDPSEVDYIKRIIGLPGDKIMLKDGDVYVNDKKLDEPYAKGRTLNQSILDFPITVPPDSVFVLGDNRENSRDSRAIGFVPYDRIKGKAVLRIWPLKDFGILK